MYIYVYMKPLNLHRKPQTNPRPSVVLPRWLRQSACNPKQVDPLNCKQLDGSTIYLHIPSMYVCSKIYVYVCMCIYIYML